MKRTLFFLSFILVDIAAIAQVNPIDSLESLLRKPQLPDSTKARALIDLSYLYAEKDPAIGLQVADRAMEVVMRSRDTSKLIEAFYNKGYNYHMQSDYPNSLMAYTKCKELAEATKDTIKLFSLRNATANVYLKLSRYTEALQLYLENLRLAEILRKKKGMALSLSNIARVHKNLNQNEEALQFNKRAIDLYKELDEKNLMTNAFNLRGAIFDQMEKPDSAIRCYKEGIRLAKEIGNSIEEASLLVNTAITYITLNRFVEAWQHTKAAESTYSEMGEKSNLAVIYSALAEIIQKAPDQDFATFNIPVSARYKTALEHYNRSLSLAKEIDAVSSQGDAWKKIAELHKANRNYADALAAFEQFLVLHDSIFNDENRLQIEQMEMNFAFQQKEDSLKAVHAQHELLAKTETAKEVSRKKAILFGAIIIFIASIISFIFYKRRKDASQLQKEAELRTEITDTEMKALRAQMNPHFIFNSLNSIADYISKNNISDADKYLGKFAKLMRMILENSEQKEVPLREDLKALSLYMDLEAMRGNDKFKYEIDVDATIDQDQTMVPPLILQPFVENSILHGFANKIDTGKIKIKILPDENMILCTVEDNGKGMKASTLNHSAGVPERTSMGMKITKARIDILNKVRNTTAGFKIFDIAQGTRVDVNLPLHHRF